MAARIPYTDDIPVHDLGRMSVECRFCGALHWIDEKLTSSSISSPKFGSCCKAGSDCPPISLSPFPDPPDALRALFDGDTPQARDFRLKIWKYNRAFAFTSIQANIDHSINNRGPPVYRIQGELFHRYGPLEVAQSQQPSYAQLYIYNPQAALDFRKAANSDLRSDVLQILQDIIGSSHQYAHYFRHAYEVLHD